MNIFRLAGDMSHSASILLLLLKLQASKSAIGISLKTQELFMVVFLSRYADLFFRYYSLYNSVMKVLYISLTGLIIHTIRQQMPIKATYDKSQDSFLHWKFAVAPCAVLAVLVHAWNAGADFQKLFRLQQFLWTFSEVLEPMAIVPQLIVLQRYREVENLTGHYVFFLGAYRFLYILNWVWRAFHEKGYSHSPLLYFAALVQTLLYADFFYYYFLRHSLCAGTSRRLCSKYTGGRLSLPS